MSLGGMPQLNTNGMHNNPASDAGGGGRLKRGILPVFHVSFISTYGRGIQQTQNNFQWLLVDMMTHCVLHQQGAVNRGSSPCATQALLTPTYFCNARKAANSCPSKSCTAGIPLLPGGGGGII